MKKKILLTCFAVLFGLLGVHAQDGLRVGNKIVTSANKNDILGDGKVVYDSDENYLWLKDGAVIDGNGDHGISFMPSSAKSLKLFVTGKVTINGGNNAGIFVGVNGTLEITSAANYGWYANITATSNSNHGIRCYGSMSVFRCDITATGGSAGFGGGSNYIAKSITLNASKIKATATSGSSAICYISKLNMTDCYVSSPTGADFDSSKQKVVASDGTDLKTATITPSDYGVQVAGVAVTAMNYTDILYTQSANKGKVSYDHSSRTLNLKGANINCGTNAILCGPTVSNLTINVTDPSTLTSTGANGIYKSGGSVTIKGGNKLTINTSTDSYRAVMLYSGAKLVVESTDVEANANLGAIGGSSNSNSSTVVINNSTITGKTSNTSFSSGLFYEIRQLDLNKATIDGQGIGVYTTNTNGVNINLTGSNNVTTSRYFIYDGKGKLSISGQNTDSDKLTAKTTGNGLLMTTFSEIEFKKCTINHSGGYYAMYPNATGVVVTFDACVFESTVADNVFKDVKGGFVFKNGSAVITSDVTYDKSKGGYVDGSGILVKTIKIGGKSYGFKYAGTYVTTMNHTTWLPSGASYDEASNTLTLNNVSVTKNVNNGSVFVFYKGCNGINVEVKGTNSLTNTQTNGYAMTFYDLTNATISGTGKLRLEGNGASLRIKDGNNLTIKDCSVEVYSTSSAGSYTITGDMNGTGTLTVDKATLYAESKNDYPAILDLKSLTLKGGCKIVKPNGGKYDTSNKSIVDASGNSVRIVEISPVESYNILVGLKNVNSDNCNDVFGNGTVSYNFASNTLTLDNANILDGPIYSTDSRPLTIVIKGKNKINSSSTLLNHFGIFANSDLTIIGNSKSDEINITTKAADNSSYYYAPIATLEGDIDLRNCSVFTTDEVRGITCMKYDKPHNVTLNNVALNSSITYSTTDHAAITNAKQVKLVNSTIETNGVAIFCSDFLTIDAEGTNGIKSESPIAAIIQSGEGKQLRIQGISANNTSLIVSGALNGILTDSPCLITSIDIDCSGTLYGWAANSTYPQPLTLNALSGTFKGGEKAFHHLATPSLLNKTIEERGDIYYNLEKGTYFDTLDEIVKEVRFVIGEDLGLNVAGRRVTNLNKGDILGDGTVKYDDVTNTLSLTNASISGNFTNVIESYNPADFNVLLSGTNFLKSESQYGNGILSGGNIYVTSIDGHGELNIELPNALVINHYKAIASPAKITIDDCLIVTETKGSALGGNEYVQGEVELIHAAVKSVIKGVDVKNAAIADVTKVTLNNSSLLVNGEQFASGIYSDKDIDIYVEGTNDINTIASDSQNSIYLGEHATKLNFFGSGIDFAKLDIVASQCAVSIYDAAEVVVKDMTMNVGTSKYGIAGVKADVTLENSNVVISSEDAALKGINTLTMLGDVKLLEPVGAAYSSADKTVKTSADEVAKYVAFGPMTATIYDLKVHNTQVTSDNCNDILGDGTLVFDPATKTLTMNNLNDESFTSNFFTSDIEDLVVVLNGENYEKNGVMTFNKPATITGSGSLRVSQAAGHGGAAIMANADLTIIDTNLNLGGSTKGIGGSASANVTINNSYVTIQKTLGGGLRDINSVVLIGCGYETPYGAFYDIFQKHICDLYGEKTLDKLVIRPVTKYDLKVYDDIVNDINCVDILYDGGSVKYDDATKTLTVNGYNDDLLGFRFIESNIPGLTIDFVGTNKIKSSGILLNEKTTITGNLELQSNGIAISMNSDEVLKIKDANIKVTAPRGIIGNGHGLIVVNNSEVVTSCDNGGIADFDDIELYGCDFATPLRGRYDVTIHSVSDLDGSQVNNVNITPATRYDLFVGYTGMGQYQVSSLIAHDILGDGTMKYDEAANKLTLDHVDNIYVSLNTVIPNLTIEPKQENNIGQIFLDHRTTIDGEGTLVVYDDMNEASIYTSNDVTVKNATLVAVNGIVGLSGYSSVLTVDNAHVTAFGGINGCISGFTNLVLNESVIVEPVDAGFDPSLNAVALNGSVVMSEVSIVPSSEAGVHEISLDGDADAKMFDTMGRRVTDSYRGIIIRNGKKYTNK